MRIIKWVGGGLLLVAALVAVVGLALPRQFRVERSIVVAAPPEAIYPLVNRFAEWPGWTAWNKERFPDMEVSFAGPAEGIGAQYAWTGESTGQGNMEITASDPQEGIAYDLAFDNGAMQTTGGLSFAAASGGTKVTWYSAGDLGWNPINRYFGLALDGMMGPDFEKGLANLKKRAEAAAKEPPAAATGKPPPPSAELPAGETPPASS